MTTHHTPDSSSGIERSIAATLDVLLRRLATEAARQSPIRVRQSASGQWDVVLRLDGGYRDRDDAERTSRVLYDALVSTAPQLPIMRPFDDVRAAADPGSGVLDLLAAMTEDEEPRR